MQLLKMIIENFKQFKGKHEIEFAPGFNLVQGPNGSGKTGILNAIYFEYRLDSPFLQHFG